MAITFDEEKNARNIAERGLSFERASDLDRGAAVIVDDLRRGYGEPRLRIMARPDAHLHVAVVPPRGEDLRAISFRRANKKEEGLWQKSGEMIVPLNRMPTTQNGQKTISLRPGQRPRC